MVRSSYTNLFLTNESIERVLKISQKTKSKSIGKGFSSLVKPGAEKDAVQECKKCDYKAAPRHQDNNLSSADLRVKEPRFCLRACMESFHE